VANTRALSLFHLFTSPPPPSPALRSSDGANRPATLHFHELKPFSLLPKDPRPRSCVRWQWCTLGSRGGSVRRVASGEWEGLLKCDLCLFTCDISPPCSCWSTSRRRAAQVAPQLFSLLEPFVTAFFSFEMRSCILVGVCLDEQIVHEVPREAHDVSVDM
jgi:hypothetical protein